MFPRLPWPGPGARSCGLKAPPNNYDAPWKFIVREFLRFFFEMLFPSMAAGIDWTRPARFHDTRLGRIGPGGMRGEMRADMLVEVGLLGGGEAMVLVHIEVQAQRDAGLGLRMYRYHYRIHDVYERFPVSLVVLADDEPGWHPGPFEHGTGPSVSVFRFETCKLLEVDLGPWLAGGNPVAWVVRAHRVAQGTRGDDEARLAGKLALMRELRRARLGEDVTLKVMRAMHCLLALPPEMEDRLAREWERTEGAMDDTIMSTYEWVLVEKGLARGRAEGRVEGRAEGHAKGRAEGVRAMLLDLLRERFGRCGRSLSHHLAGISDEVELRRLARLAVKVPSLAEFEREIGRA